MRILHVVTTLDVGGAEVHLLAQVRGQAARGHDVRVAWIKGAGSLREEFLTAGAQQVVRLSASPLAALRLWSHARWAEIVHSHLLKADALAALVAPLAGRRGTRVSGKHNDEQVLRKPLVSVLHGLIGRIPARTIVLSELGIQSAQAEKCLIAQNLLRRIGNFFKIADRSGIIFLLFMGIAKIVEYLAVNHRVGFKIP